MTDDTTQTGQQQQTPPEGQQQADNKTGSTDSQQQADDKSQQQTGSVLGDGAQDSTSGSKEGTQEGQPKAPEKYDLRPTRGLLNEHDLKEIETAAREAGLTQEQAQAVVDQAEDRAIAHAARLRAETEADSTYGGANLTQTRTHALAVIDRVRPPGHPGRAELFATLNRTGLANDLRLVSLLADLGRLMAEDRTVLGTPGSGAPPAHDLAARMYPNDAPN